MATKRELTTDIRKRYGNMLTVKEVADYLGVERHKASDWLRYPDPVDCYVVGRKRLYLAADIAKRLEATKNT